MSDVVIVGKGSTFGLWTVQDAPQPNRFRVAMAPCRCICGARAKVTVSNLVVGNSKGCRRCRGANPKTPRDRAKRVRLLHEEGLSFTEIGRRLGVSRQRAHYLYHVG